VEVLDLGLVGGAPQPAVGEDVGEIGERPGRRRGRDAAVGGYVVGRQDAGAVEVDAGQRLSPRASRGGDVDERALAAAHPPEMRSVAVAQRRAGPAGRALPPSTGPRDGARGGGA
jgi:hypothetical protein